MLIVVRGNTKSCDPNYRCVIHDASSNKYGVLNLNEDGSVLERKSFSKLEDVYAYVDSTQKDVYMDERPSKNLLPKPNIPHSYDAACVIKQCRRNKSEEEKSLLESIHSKTMQVMRSVTDETQFRSSAKEDGYKSFSEITEHEDFTQKRFGLQYKGLCSYICDAVPKNDEWKTHILSSKKNLVNIKSELVVGNTVESIEEKFRSIMEKDGLKVKDPVIYGIGYENTEDFGDVVEKNQVYSISVKFAPKNDSSKTCMIRTLALPIHNEKEIEEIKDRIEEKQYRSSGGIYVETGVFGLSKSLDLNIAHIFLGLPFVTEKELLEKSKYLKNDPRLIKSVDASTTIKVVSHDAIKKDKKGLR